MWKAEYKRTIILIDLTIYLLSLLGIYQIIHKPDLPFSLEKSNSKLFIVDSEIYPQLRSAVLISVNGIHFSSREELEVYIDSKNIGEAVLLHLNNHGTASQNNVKIISFYTTFDIITILVTGTLFFLIALFVLFKSAEKKSAILFHWVVVITAVIMMTTWGNFNILPYPLGFMLRAIFHSAYLAAPVVFLHFKLSFPLDRSNKVKKVLAGLYITAFILSLIQTVVFVITIYNGFAGWTAVYMNWFNIGRILFITCVLASLAVFIYSFLTIKSHTERKKLKWLLLGYLIGPASFVFLWVVPQAITGNGLLSEAVVIMLMSAIPVTFAISILKYHLLDIDLILNRSFVYAIVIGSLLIIYTLIITVSAYFAGEYAQGFPVLAAIIIALIFQPLKNVVQKIVDVKFFRVTYNYRQVIKKLIKEISNSGNLVLLSEKIIKEINLLIPTQRSAFVLYNSTEKNLNILCHANMERFQPKKYFLKNDDMVFHTPMGLRDAVEHGVSINFSEAEVFRLFDLVLIFPIKSIDDEVFAFLVLGRKKAGNRFTAEDIDLLLQVSAEAGSTIERIYLNDKYIAEHFEKEKLEELNQLKSYFVSSVSHELKTPLTSIQMFSEILSNNANLAGHKREEYFNIINGECSRLTRMIDNVLNVAKIEKGIKDYKFEIIDFDAVVDEAIRVMEYQLTTNKFITHVTKGPGEKLISADKDAILEIIVNLISNSIKYSRDRKEISICTDSEQGFISIVIEDKGIGIPSEDIHSIFNPYFRSNDPEAKRILGTGLGLAIVKHVVDAHNGTINVESKLGTGTAFKLSFRAISQKSGDL